MFAFEGCLTIFMIVYVLFLGFIKLSDTNLPIGTLDILNIACLLFVVKTYTTNSKIIRRLESLKAAAEKGFKENQKVLSEEFKNADEKRLETSIRTGLSIKNITNSVLSLNGLVAGMGVEAQERLGMRHSLGLEIC